MTSLYILGIYGLGFATGFWVAYWRYGRGW